MISLSLSQVNLTSGPISSGVWGILAVLIVGGISIIALVFWVWMLMDLFSRKNLSPLVKALWLILVFSTQVVGALIYYLVYSPKWNSKP